MAERRHTRALLILKDGKIAYERYYNGFGRDSAWYWASAGKTLAAFLMGIARQNGQLVLEKKSSDYLGVGWTNCTRAQEDSIKVIHQITMTTGLDYTVPDLDCTDPSCLRYRAAPGTQWFYHNAPYLLTHKVLEQATGQSLNAYTANKLFLQTGMRGLWYDGIFYSTARTMARFGLLLQAKGNWNGTPLLSDTAYFHKMTHSSQQLNPSYGYLTWLNGQSAYMLPLLTQRFPGELIPNAPEDMYAALGKNDQKLHIVPSMGLVIVRMGDDAGAGGLAPTVFDNELWRYMNRVLCPTGTSNYGIQYKALEIYPLPADSKMVVESVEGGCHLTLLSAQGQKAWEMVADKQGDVTVDVSKLPSGLYHLIMDNSHSGLRQVKRVSIE